MKVKKSDFKADLNNNDGKNIKNNDNNNENYDIFFNQSVQIGSFLNFNNKSCNLTTKKKYRSLVKTCTNNIVNKNEFVLVKYKRISSQSYDDSHLIQISPSKINQVQKRREMHSLLLFIFFLFVTIITLSQILVMHSQSNGTNFYQIKLMQEELKLMDSSIDKMVNERHVLPMQAWYALKQYYQNIKRIYEYINFITLTNNDVNMQIKDIFKYRNKLKKCIENSKSLELNSSNKHNFSTNGNKISIQSLNEIYNVLTNFIDDSSFYTGLSNNNNITRKNTFFKLLNIHMSKLNEIIPKLKLNSKVKLEKCLELILTISFYMINNHSYFFERITNITLLNYNMSTINNKNFWKKNEKNFNLKKYSFSNKSFCDPQPPILCK